jgi:hypothetical protein
MRKLKYIKLFENFENVKYPNSIRVKLTDTWKKSLSPFGLSPEFVYWKGPQRKSELMHYEEDVIKGFKQPFTEVDLPNNDEIYTYIGATVGHGNYYFASRRDNLIFIIWLDATRVGFGNAEKTEELFFQLTNGYPKTKHEINDFLGKYKGLRQSESGTRTLGEHNNPDYRGELRVGMTDDKGYFEIVSMK